MPTGVHLHDARQQLFDAAERVLLRGGPSALTSRAVTAEAEVSKGVLHRHFADFDDFLAELVRERLGRLEDQRTTLRGSAGTGTLASNLTSALIEIFDPVAVAIVSLILFRDELRARLRHSGRPHGIPLLTEATAMIAAYLTDECELGRVAADTDAGTLALSLVGTGHLLFADQEHAPSAEFVESAVRTVIADVVQRRLL
ncbi:TetR/AcrR family transcriptional regulator [Amycolatopsis sp. K13G38]|uniref:TetR/AcrR family transcriptional regulator n=1 Tax=Amycolatopsis acididurans TaxID=2724524 RepID=A0ABX1IYI1_9PSEU|nr:TetR/AcrR family transcriptional regulator [Amycolatopsis acididurans]NKQ52211.1 TetR/AcrR family transcriptional regulator [Amycolatopsis acididurans]